MDRDGAVVVGQIHTQPKKTEEKTQEDVAKEIKNWIQLDNEDIDLKLLPNAVNHIESELGRQLSSLETTCLEWQYVKIVLEMWHSEAFRKMFDDLENPATDISIELSTLLCELNSVNSFQEIDTKLEVDGSRLRIWCDGGCRYLQMIVKQEELFKDTPRFTILVPCYFNHFKIFCINELFSRCWNYVVNDTTNGKKYRKFLSALNNSLAKIMECKKFQDVIEKTVSYNMLTMDSTISCPECIKMICEHIPTDSTEVSLIQRFKQAAASISDDGWTREFTSLVKEILKKNLLPKTNVQVKNEDGREIISIQGNVVFLSKIMEKMIELKSNIVQEIQIVGLVSVHVDCDLENDIWHGINVGVITDKIIVDCEVSWDVSGQHITHQGAEEPRQPGESGGNVHLVCNEMINENQWTIISDGGDGSAAHKWTRDEFKNAFPSMSLFGGAGDRNMVTIATKLRNLLPGERVSQLLTQPNFIIDEFMEDVQKFMVSFYKTEKERHSLIFLQGRGVGQGGYGGTVTLEILNRPPFLQPSLPFIGFQKRLLYATQMSDVFQASRSDGKTGKPAGDVGFIHNVNSDNCATNMEGNYFGFEIDTRLELNFSNNPSEGKNSCARQVQNVENPLKRYTSIEIKEGVPETKRLVEAVKKKAILRQNLFQHLSQINQRKEMFQTLQAMFDSPLQSHPISRDEVLAKQVQSIEIQLRQLSFRSQQFQMDNKQAKMVKPACLEQLKPYDLDSAPLLAYQQQVVTGSEDVASTLNSAIDPGQTPKERNVEYIIIVMMRQNSEGSDRKDRSENIFLTRINEIVQSSKETDLNAAALSQRDLVQERRATERYTNVELSKNEWSKNGLDLTSDVQLAYFLYVYNHAVKEQLGFPLRDAQRVAIMTLLQKHPHSRNTLVQVSTGEGKSLIVCGVAIAFALSEKKKSKSFCHIDVITSNSVLALRDSTLSSDKGGLKDIYEFFNVSVANNCSHSIEERTNAYDSAVVYGELANFQRDYLLDEFYGRNIRGRRSFEYVIIDEVDCMLLDRGNNTLYLSHDIPGMETLESLYVFIWDEIWNSRIDKAIPDYREQVKKSIKSDVLFDLYGVTTIEDLQSVHKQLDDSEKDALWKHLIEKKIIDEKWNENGMKNGRLLIDDVNKITEKMINYIPENKELQRKNLDAKLVFYLRQVANRQRRIRIPAHLLDFVDRHLDTWLESAFQALDLRPDEDYVIDQDRTDMSPDLNPKVIIIDRDTGTDQTSSQWDEALHQFIQLKEGCKLSLQSIKAVFISNAMYIKQYPYISGLSGTLGSKQEQQFLCETFKGCLHFPTPFPKKFDEKLAKVLSTENEWLDAIIEETKTILKEGRSIVIFCEFIKDVNLVHQRLKSSIPELKENNRLHRYTRDYVKFVFEGTKLDIGHVIVATNLAGRGTDIKISQKLRENGGLHVCLSYFPENERIQEQAMGRAARNRARGSGILIVCKSIPCKGRVPDERELIDVMKSERELKEKQRIARMAEDFKGMEDQREIFQQFSSYFNNLKDQLSEKKYDDQIVSAICGSVLDQWALWLDEMNDLPLDVKKYSYSEKFIPKLKAVEQDNLDISQVEWMTPARLVVVAKPLATRSKKPDFPMAATILEKLIQSKDNQFYPAAYYYRAFIHLKENYETNKNEFIKTLRTCENVLSDHINMQISFFSTVQTTKRKIDQPLSFCVVDGYTQQKENVINVLQYFVGSVRSLLGTDCAIEDFEAAGQLPKEVEGFLIRNIKKFVNWIDEERKNFRVFQEKDEQNKESVAIPPEMVEKYFKLLLEGESKCIGHQLNDASTIPSWNSSYEQHAKSNRELAIKRIANAYGVCALTLGKSLDQEIKTALSKEAIEEAIEKKMKQKFEKDHLIPCTRESFWAKLVETGALYNNENFVAVDEGNVDTFNLNREEAKTFHFEDKDYVLYNPIDVNSKNRGEKKIFFTQKYFETRWYTTHGNRNFSREQFQFNKMAKIDVKKLKSVDLRLFGQLKDDHLHEADISPAERQGILEELKKQDIIDVDGNLSSNYNGQMFEYPNCPAYEETVMRLVGSKLRVEIVRRQWLNSKNHSNRLKAINLLPLTPYRDMLDDLIAAYVISGGVRVNGMDEHVLNSKVNEITKKEHERECILDFLKSRQAIYDATWLTSKEAALDFIDGDIRKVKANTIESELCLFRLMGFDHVIYMKDRRMSRKQKVLFSLFAPIVFVGGVASIVAGGAVLFLKKILPFLPLGVAKDLLLMGGLSDIIFVITSALSNDPIRFPDYARQRIRSALGKSNLVDQVKTLWKLSTPGKLAGNNFRPAVRLQMDSFHQRRVREKNHEADQREIVNALLRLEKISTHPSDENDGELVRKTCL